MLDLVFYGVVGLLFLIALSGVFVGEEEEQGDGKDNQTKGDQ